ncbi:hypothetical protein JCM9533A_64550 [Catenuloplanes niger JCM 9533]
MSPEAARTWWFGTADDRHRPSGGGENRRRGARSLGGSGHPGAWRRPGVTSLTVPVGGGRVACGPMRRARPGRGRTWTAAGERFVAWWVTPRAYRVSPAAARPIGTGHGRAASAGVTERDLAGPGTTGRGTGATAGAAVAGRTSAIDRMSVETERVVA